MTSQPVEWVSDACTLPTAERPLRVAEFRELFAAALHSQTRVASTHLRLTLNEAAEIEVGVRDLIVRESACCSFFDFTVTRTSGDQLTVDVRVPAGQVAVLDALSAMAAVAA